jgi:predicted methyltransferase
MMHREQPGNNEGHNCLKQGGDMLKVFAEQVIFYVGLLSMLAVGGCATTQSKQDFSSILADKERPDTEKALDSTRKPNEVLAFYGVKSGDKVADIFAARGYYTAILSQVVGPQGTVYSAVPAARPELAERFKNPKFTNVRLVEGPLDKLALSQDGSLDFVLIHLNYHDLSPDVRIAMNKRILGALKRGGVYGVVDHSAKEGSGNEAVKTLHRIDKLLVIKEVSDSGFKLAKEGTMLSRPEDKRDFNVNKERNLSDRFVLAFQKP